MKYCTKLDPLQYYIFHTELLPEMGKADHSLTLHDHSMQWLHSNMQV